MKTAEQLAEVIAQAEWEFQGVHQTFRIEPAQRHLVIAQAVLREMSTPPGTSAGGDQP